MTGTYRSIRDARIRSLFTGAVVVTALLFGLAVPSPTQGQVSGTLRGVVRSASTGAPVVGAIVQIIGTNVVAQTDDRGRYGLMSVPIGVSVIRITHQGHVGVSEKLDVARPGVFLRDFQMMAPDYVLEEMVAKAMRRGATTPDNALDEDELDRGSSIPEMLDQVSGVTLVRTNGGLGAGWYLRIRGARSISFNRLPVIILDGIRVQGGAADGGAGALELLSPSSIGSVQVLRGASARAQYGPGASDGVILIKTKRGGS